MESELCSRFLEPVDNRMKRVTRFLCLAVADLAVALSLTFARCKLGLAERILRCAGENSVNSFQPARKAAGATEHRASHGPS
jgi:hypothetical protein